MTLEELLDLSLELSEVSTEALYVEVLINYLQGNSVKLEKIVNKINKYKYN